MNGEKKENEEKYKNNMELKRRSKRQDKMSEDNNEGWIGTRVGGVEEVGG